MRSTRIGAYRDFISHVLTGNIEAEVSYLSDIEAKGSITVSGEVKEKNVVSFSRRNIKMDTLNIYSSIGSDNIIEMYFRSKSEYKNASHILTIGDENRIKVRTKENPINITIGSRNVIEGYFNAGDIVIGNSNLLYNFSGILKDGTKVTAIDKLGSLMFKTVVTEYAGYNSSFITVKDTRLMMIGGEIKFGTTGAAFTRKTIKSIIGDKVYLDTPLTLKESTYPDAVVFNDLPVTVETKVFYTTSDSVRLSKRLPISEVSDLPLRDITVGGSFKTKIFFVRSSDNIAIVKDLIPENFPSNTAVVAQGRYPYDAKSWNITGVVDESANVVSVDDITGAYVGRVLTDTNGVDHTIIGFIDSNLILDNIPALGIASSTEEDQYPSVENSQAIVSGDHSVDTTLITLNDHSFNVGDEILFDGFSDMKTVISVSGNTIELSSKLIPSELNNIICFGNYIVDRNYNHREFVESNSSEINNYLFGEM